MSSSPALEQSPPSSVAPPSPALRAHDYPHFHTSTPNYTKKHHQQPLNVCLPATAPATPPHFGEPSLTPPPRSPGASIATPASGDGRCHPPDGTSSDKSSETAVGSSTAASTALSRKESYKAQRQHYRKEKKRAASAILHSIEDPTVVVLSDWLKVRGTLKSWTKLWCILKPGLLLLYKSPKAKRSHWVGTVLLTSCQVIERPSKKDGFCFKLYHPLEQSIWAPRGPHNETTRAVVQPLPTAHLIFRAPSQAAGHCWLDGLELALRCSNAMLRCSRSRPEQTVAPDAPATQTNISHEELEKHFNEHVLKLAETGTNPPTPLMSVSDYTSNYAPVISTPRDKIKKRKISKCTLVDSSKDHSSDSSDDKKNGGFLDFLRRKDFERKSTSVSLTPVKTNTVKTCRSLTNSPMNKRSQIFNCFDIKFLSDKNGREVTRCISPSKIIEDNLIRLITTFPKRRSSTPSVLKTNLNQKCLHDKATGEKYDSDNGGSYLNVFSRNTRRSSGSSEILCKTPESIVIMKTAPSGGDGSEYSSSSYDGDYGKKLISIKRSRGPKNLSDIYDIIIKPSSIDASEVRNSPALRAEMASRCSGKFSLINYERLPSASFEEVKTERTRERCDSHQGHVSGTVVANELAGAASDTDSECHGMPEGQTSEDQVTRKRDVLARIENVYVEDPDREIGAAGELVEEVAEENKSLLWFLLKQVRPGMDLSKVVLPTFILEPRSFLDKLSDNYYHADLLAQAQTLDDPYQRFKCVLRWYLSGLYRKPKGLKKPYNPVLGEAFRCCWRHPDSQTYTYYIAEQVSHHPPISAFYISNRKEGFVIEGSLLARSKFYGNSTSAILEGCARVHLLNWGESYVTTAPYAHCKGIVIGTLSMELGGKVHVICQETGYQADIEFKLRSFLGGADQTNAISGRIKKGKETVASVDGYWDGKIDIKDKKTGEESNLLDVAVLKEQRLPRFLVKVEQQQECESQRLWMKVSEAILNDDQVAATEQKTIIEEAQRARAKSLLSPWIPRLFRRDLTSIPPEGIIDQGWRYSHSNTSSWQLDEVIEYEDDFVITSLRTAVSCPAPEPRLRDLSQRASDTDSHDELARRSKNSAFDEMPRRAKASTRSLKQALFTIDTTLRDQTVAIERLSKTVENLQEAQRATAFRPQNVGRLPTTAHSWDLFGGFVLAMVLQALLNWLFYHKD